jgi:hypothetical protein
MVKIIHSDPQSLSSIDIERDIIQGHIISKIVTRELIITVETVLIEELVRINCNQYKNPCT